LVIRRAGLATFCGNKTVDRALVRANVKGSFRNSQTEGQAVKLGCCDNGSRLGVRGYDLAVERTG